MAKKISGKNSDYAKKLLKAIDNKNKEKKAVVNKTFSTSTC